MRILILIVCQVNLVHIHKEVVTIKRDVELIKNILYEEGVLTEEAKKRLAEARATSRSRYVKLAELD